MLVHGSFNVLIFRNIRKDPQYGASAHVINQPGGAEILPAAAVFRQNGKFIRRHIPARRVFIEHFVY